jgi:hypothetical protein
VFLVNSRFPLFSATLSSSVRGVRHSTGVLLIPKLRRYFAEFLNHSSPDRLGILYLSTCVGLGYGHPASSLGTFLDSIGSVTSPKRLGIASQTLRDPDLPRSHPTRLPQDNQRLGSPTFLRPPIASIPGNLRFAISDSPIGRPVQDWRGLGGTGISTGCASTTPLGLALAPDLPWAD